MRYILVFLLLATPALAQQMPAGVERPLAPIAPAALPPTPPASTGTFATMAATSTALMGYAPSATLMVKATPTTSVKPYQRPQPKPQLVIQPTGPNRYIILPQESPLATAPLATVNPAKLVMETETALPEDAPTPAIGNALTTDGLPATTAPLPPVWHEQPIAIPNTNLATAPQLTTVPTQPESGITWQTATPPAQQQDITTRLNQLATRLESVSDQATQLQTRLESTEETTTPPTSTPQPSSTTISPPPALSAKVPYVNDATQPGPQARKQLASLAQSIQKAYQTSGATPKSLTVTATVATPPIGQTAMQLARARHFAGWLYLNSKLPAALKLPGTGNTLVVKEAANPANQSQYIKINW